jgi:carboxypeptidase PM20D1
MQSVEERISRAAALDGTAAAERLAGAVRLKTITYDNKPDASAAEFVKLHGYLETSFPLTHRTLKREIVGGYSLLYTWQGSDASAKPIMLMAHSDVVPIAEGTDKDWSVDPFAGTVKDGYIWGRGSWDDKGNLLSILEAVKTLVAQGFQPKQTIYIVSGHDEEGGGERGAKKIAELLASRSVKLDFVMDEGTLITEGVMKGLDKPVALIGVAEKGIMTLSLSTHDEPGHSSMLVKRELEKSKGSNAFTRTTTALTVVHAGNKVNVVPAHAEAFVNFRMLPGDTQQEVIEHAHSVVGNAAVKIERSGFASDASPISSTASPSYRLMNATIREVFPGTVVAPGLMVAATDSRHMLPIADHVYRFSPVRVKEKDLSRFHGTDERISIENYSEMIAFYHRLITSASQTRQH